MPKRQAIEIEHRGGMDGTGRPNVGTHWPKEQKAGAEKSVATLLACHNIEPGTRGSVDSRLIITETIKVKK